MARKPMTLQLDLFSNPSRPGIDQVPHWQTLPAQTRQALTSLIVRLLLDHVAGDRAAALREMRDDH